MINQHLHLFQLKEVPRLDSRFQVDRKLLSQRPPKPPPPRDDSKPLIQGTPKPPPPPGGDSKPDFSPFVISPFVLSAGVLPKTTTQLARSAISQLENASPAVLREAINTVKNKNVAANRLINHLERKTFIGEVLNELAKNWSNETKEDFVGAFNMAADKLEVMDNIVSIAILNDPDLEEELRAENTPETTEGDLQENRRIVWQKPSPGERLEPPYLILVAVEYQDVAQAEEVVQAILGELVDYQGYKVPKAIAPKLREFKF